jgi:hypothetical protein
MRYNIKVEKDFFFLKHTGCPRVVKKLHNLFVIKDINFFIFLDDSYASTAYSENIAIYIQVSQYYKKTKVMFLEMEPTQFDFIFGFYAKL